MHSYWYSQVRQLQYWDHKPNEPSVLHIAIIPDLASPPDLGTMKIRLLLLAISSCLFGSAFGQIDHWESVVLPENEWSYEVPDQEIPGWREIGFNDNSWSTGPGGIGYGDGDDNTEIDISTSLFMRHEFTIEDVSVIGAAIFHMDYDDSFVAYVNGVEIARGNIGVQGTPPLFDQFADDLHEAVMYEGALPDQFGLNAAFLETLVDGTNVLAIQVHNATDNSSDMSSIPFLHFGITDDSNDYQETPVWFNPPFSCPEELSYVQLILNTANWGGEVSWEILDGDNDVVFEGTDYSDWNTYVYDLCLLPGCYTLLMLDSYGDGWNGAQVNIFDDTNQLILSGSFDQGYEDSMVLAIDNFCPIYGCTEEGALNFDPYANTDDGSCISFGTSNLPLVIIDTDGQGIPDDPRITAHMGIVNNEDGINSVDDPFTDYDGLISIEIRGSSSQMFPKKSYAFETQDAEGNNNNVSLIDLPPENDWILHAPYSDKTLMRNVLTFDLGRKADRYTPGTKYCEVILNGEYRGIYVLMESIKRDENRVDIATLLPEDIEGDELTGGYILKVDKFTGGGGDGWESNYLNEGQTDFPYIQFHRPKPDVLTDEQKQYIEFYVHDFENALAGDDFEDPDFGYEQYIDVSSFIDLSLINELSRNIDGYRLSTYFYKDKDSNGGKITMGPWWDYNLSFGNADYCSGQWWDGWEVSGDCAESNPFWFERLKEHELYQNKMKCRWEKLRADEWSDQGMEDIIDSISDYLADAAVRNFAKWPTLGSYIWPNWYTDSEVYQDEVDYLKEWTQQRLNWIDENIEGTCIQGCMDEMACNYSSEALCDDGSCEYMTLFDITGELVPTLFETYTYTYPDTPGSSYLWTSVNGIIESGQGTATVEVTWLAAGVGQLFVVETSEQSCVADQVELLVNAVGPTNILNIDSAEIILYPNPSAGAFQIQLPRRFEDISVEITDPMGQLVLSRVYAQKQVIQMDFELSSGAYFLTAKTGTESFTTKLVIQ
jgi:spore coat protein CotH